MRNWLRSRAGLKVISLVLAMITWFFVKAVTSDSRLVENVPLEIRVKPGGTYGRPEHAGGKSSAKRTTFRPEKDQLVSRPLLTGEVSRELVE